MFRQVVGTILRLADRYADHWLPIHGSHDVPAYGFERIIEPPPLEVNTLRLLSEFHAGSLTLADTWRRDARPGDRGDGPRTGRRGRPSRRRRADPVSASAATWRPRRPPRSRWPRRSARSTSPTTCGRGSSTTWSSPRATRRPSLEALVAALVPIYFGRVGSFVIENRHVTDRAGRGARRAPGPRVRAAQAVPRRRAGTRPRLMAGQGRRSRRGSSSRSPTR